MQSILLVDDQSTTCSEFARTLEEFGYRVETAHTVESARRAARRVHFDAVLVEFNLRSERTEHPRTGKGIELVRGLRTAESNLPIFVVTDMEGDFYEAISRSAGADDFIPKIDSVSTIIARLQSFYR